MIPTREEAIDREEDKEEKHDDDDGSKETHLGYDARRARRAEHSRRRRVVRARDDRRARPRGAQPRDDLARQQRERAGENVRASWW